MKMEENMRKRQVWYFLSRAASEPCTVCAIGVVPLGTGAAPAPAPAADMLHFATRTRRGVARTRAVPESHTRDVDFSEGWTEVVREGRRVVLKARDGMVQCEGQEERGELRLVWMERYGKLVLMCNGDCICIGLRPREGVICGIL